MSDACTPEDALTAALSALRRIRDDETLSDVTFGQRSSPGNSGFYFVLSLRRSLESGAHTALAQSPQERERLLVAAWSREYPRAVESSR